MRKRSVFTGLASLALLTAVTSSASALQPKYNQTLQGDFALIGNTLGHDCQAGKPLPAVGTVNCMMAGDVTDQSPDIFWHAEGANADANTTVTAEQASSTAVLNIPSGATIQAAFLHWAARKSTSTGDQTAVLERPGEAPLNASADFGAIPGQENVYGSSADVTEYVKQHGAGPYKVSGVESVPLNSSSAEKDAFAVWWMVVVYEDTTMPHRRLIIQNGLDNVGNAQPVDVTIKDFIVPKKFGEAKLGVIGYDGDKALTGPFTLRTSPVSALSPS